MKKIFMPDRQVFMAGEKGPGEKPESMEKAQKPAAKPKDVETKEGRQRIYKEARVKIEELKTEGDAVSLKRANSLETRLKMAEDDEKSGGLENPADSARRLMARLESIVKPQVAPTAATEAQVKGLVATLDKLDKETRDSLAKAGAKGASPETDKRVQKLVAELAKLDKETRANLSGEKPDA